ncbi:MAG TPA: hypothetical protein DEO54_11295 [Rikenellaceae bacterium]|nr:MAG: hypothetical protein A2X20_11325 [Bacteroidetes bacterium GWE2_40_15]HBZ26795.1 hypothetical protein [Rikenellaceae bacterium]
MKTRIVLIGLALAASTTFAAAQNNSVKTTAIHNNKSCFVDADKNGVCDSFEKGTCTLGNGKGLMDGSGRRGGLRDGQGMKKGNRNGLRDGSGAGNGNGHGLMNGEGPRHEEGYRNGDGRRGRRK